MGFTSKSKSIIEPLLSQFKITSVCDLGAQNNYTNEVIITNPVQYPYISEWYLDKGVNYMSIDLNGENGSKKWDLDQPLKTKQTFDMVCDLGTGEHCRDLYQVLANIHQLTKLNGIVVRENPKTGNWPGHGFNYVDAQFYYDFCEVSGYKMLHIEEHPAMGNYKDGWNVLVVMQKVKEEFITREQLPNVFTK